MSYWKSIETLNNLVLDPDITKFNEYVRTLLDKIDELSIGEMLCSEASEPNVYLLYEKTINVLLQTKLSEKIHNNVCLSLLYGACCIKNMVLIDNVLEKCCTDKHKIINELHHTYVFEEEVFEWIWNFSDLIPDDVTLMLNNACERMYSKENIMNILNAYEPSNDEYDTNELIETIIYNKEHTWVLQYILDKWHIDIKPKYVVMAIYQRNLEIINILIKNGFDPTQLKITDSNATSNKTMNFINQLQEYGFDPFVVLSSMIVSFEGNLDKRMGFDEANNLKKKMKKETI